MRFAKVAIVAGLSIAAVQAQASSQTGYVRKVAYTGSRVFIWLDGADRAGASCNTAGAGARYEVDGGSVVGQSQLSILLTSFSLHQRLNLSGTNTCAIDTEAIGYLETLP